MATTSARVGRLQTGSLATRRPPLETSMRLGVGAAIALGLGLRLWLLFHIPLNSDEAVVGLMARAIRHGHFSTFFWGQAYGGVEPYLVAIWTAAWGSGTVALNSVPTVLSAATAVLTWRVARRIVPAEMNLLAVAAGLSLWIWPEVLLANSTQEFGFRGVTLAVGVAVLLFALRVTERPTLADLVGLGLCVGLGWWSSPEIAYFLVPAAIILVAGRARLFAARRARLWVVVIAAGVGAAPWLVTNVRTGFVSLHPSASPRYTTATYVERLAGFFSRAFPMALGLRSSPGSAPMGLDLGSPPGGAWLWGPGGRVLFALGVAGVVALIVVALLHARDHPAGAAIAALAVGVELFPLTYAAFPASGSRNPARFSVFLVPLVVLAATGVLGGWLARRQGVGRRHRPEARGRALAATGIVVTALIGLAAFNATFLASHPARFFTAWGNPSAPTQRAIRLMETDGITNAYAGYWDAYTLDYLSGERLVASDPLDDRWPAENARVLASFDPAWLFAPGDGPLYPKTTTAAQFEEVLRRLKVTWRIERLGSLVAVVPSRAVNPRRVAQMVRAGSPPGGSRARGAARRSAVGRRVG